MLFLLFDRDEEKPDSCASNKFQACEIENQLSRFGGEGGGKFRFENGDR